MIVANGSTGVTTYFVLRDSTNHAPKTDVSITDIDLYYLEQGSAMAAKVDATALAAADSAWDDNKAYHCGQGLYRIDWPDEAFNGGVGKRVYLIVVCTGVDTTFLEVELSPNVNTNSLTADVITAAGIADNALANEHFAAGALTSAEITSAAGCAVASIANDAITAAAIQNGAIDANTFAAGALDAVWSTAARTLTAIDEDSTTLDLDATIETILAASATIAALPTAAENADAVWDEASTGHTDAGKAGAQMWTDVDAILADTGTDGVKVASLADNSITAAAIANAAIDQATFAADVYVVANVKKINDTTLTGDGGATPWGPA